MFVKKKYLGWLKRDKYQGQEVSSEKLAVDLVRLRRGEPLDYVIGWRDFLGCRIDLSERPLIPREETEYWVDLAISDLKKDKRPKIKCLDLFAGSGCIGLAVLARDKRATVTFADKNFSALTTIKKSLKLNKSKIGFGRTKVVKSDVWSNLPGRFDYIFANPPYIPIGKKLPRSVVGYEPKEALFGGADGLDLIKKFLDQAREHLEPEGKIYLEFGFGQKQKLQKSLKNLGFLSYQFGKDQFGRYRFAVIKNSR